MTEQLRKVAHFYTNKKYKKALTILTKLNKKAPSFDSLHYTAACLFNEKKYLQAYIYYEKALQLCTEFKQKLGLLADMAATQAQIGNEYKAIHHYKEILALDDSYDTIVHRDNLCRLAAANQEHDIIFEYAPKLLKMNDYFNSGLYFLLRSHIHSTGDEKEVSRYFDKILQNHSNIDSEFAQLFLEVFDSYDYEERKIKLCEIFKARFSHEKWFHNFLEVKDYKAPSTDVEPELQKERVIGTNTELVAIIEKLLIHSESIGANYHDSLKIYEDRNELSVKVFDQTNETEKLLEIPIMGLPLLNDYRFQLDDFGKLHCKPIDCPMNPTAIESMELLCKIYNEGNKILDWKKRNPFIALNNIDFLNKLCSIKPNYRQIQRFQQLYNEQNEKELALESFIGARKIPLSRAQLKEAGIFTENSQEYALLSVIDFLNHKALSSPYRIDSNMISVTGPADESTNEVYVHYNNYDPVMTYLFYGFVDLKAAYVSSIPLHLESFSGRKIEISDAHDYIDEDKLENSLSHLRAYLPKVSLTSSENIKLNKILIPNLSESHILKEVLVSIIINIVGREHFNSLSELESLARELEVEIISKNLEFWRGFKKELSEHKPQDSNDATTPELRNLVDFHVILLQSYCSKLGVTIF